MLITKDDKQSHILKPLFLALVFYITFVPNGSKNENMLLF